MKKNLIIILAIFIIPVVLYAVLSESQTVSAAKTIAGQPKVIKFSSKLCMDCKKLKKEFEIVTPKYRDKISIIEYDVQENTPQVQSAITEYNISLVPTVIYINKHNQEVRRTEGYVNKSNLEKYFDELLK